MIVLHHLNKSRSQRIIWLLEELGLPYQIKAYQRDAATFLAPPELKAVHPLGKSPVIEFDGRVLAESGAITEYLIARHAPDRLAPAADSPEYPEYLQWLHFAESSGILPLLLDMFVRKDGSPMRFLPDYAKAECAKVLGYLDEVLANRRYLVADRLTGADILNSFLVDLLAQSGQLAQFPHLEAYWQRLNTYPARQKAAALERELDRSAE
ncbi:MULTISPECIES: glutathione S-transferase family protein [Aeromonas]|uniref:glutathione S-transferase family protein n=1 Tax=Aeromonas TaxID=642 RepID=UPI00057A1B5B|nr:MULTISPECIES: glutathione S-transferase [Aeromonas]MBL0554766.1 glutathione S-transferase [Aeromonas caviae]MDX7701782.1 glutathione S-transferase [Aeromonas caviae]MDX7841580.1 glutathione S-transferase [Aeromonas caviae]MDX7857502.1 glutathione S-transferase [Aeromonas caviae]MEA9441234.1 glutathione S-transferase [Aeromonas caviae]